MFSWCVGRESYLVDAGNAPESLAAITPWRQPEQIGAVFITHIHRIMSAVSWLVGQAPRQPRRQRTPGRPVYLRVEYEA